MLSHPICSKIFMVKRSGLQINFVTIFLANWVTQIGFKDSLYAHMCFILLQLTLEARGEYQS